MRVYTAKDIEDQLESLMERIMNDIASAKLKKHLPQLRTVLPRLATQYSELIDSTVCELALCLSDDLALCEMASSLSPIEIALINYRQLVITLFLRAQPESFSTSLPEDHAEFFVAVLNGDYAK